MQRLVQELDETAANTALILFNPKLVDMQSTGYGLVGRELRNQVEKTFLTAFALKTLVDGAVFRQYPGEFTAKTETGDPLDFQTHIHRDVLRRASEKILSRKAIQPTTSAEIQDDCRWHPASRGLQGLEG